MSVPTRPERWASGPAPAQDAGQPAGQPAASGLMPDGPRADPPGDAAPAPAASADPRVDDALSRLAEIDQLPLAEQVEVFGDIHRRLAAVLADPDSQAQ